jgi:NADH-quinone oxidoreductase subunit A
MQPIVSSGILSPWEPGIFSLAIYVVLILVFVASQLFIAVWLGEKKKTVEKLRPYESGIIPTGAARLRIVLLLLGLVYIWRKGGLDWGPIAQKD